MTVCSVYVGSLEDPKFKWDGGDWSGNAPRSISPSFPPMSQHYNGNFHDWVGITGVECRQTDYGAWVARVTKPQISEFITKCYKGDEDLPWVKDDLKEIREFVATLDDVRVYGLVATEW